MHERLAARTVALVSLATAGAFAGAQTKMPPYGDAELRQVLGKRSTEALSASVWRWKLKRLGRPVDPNAARPPVPTAGLPQWAIEFNRRQEKVMAARMATDEIREGVLYVVRRGDRLLVRRIDERRKFGDEPWIHDKAVATNILVGNFAATFVDSGKRVRGWGEVRPANEGSFGHTVGNTTLALVLAGALMGDLPGSGASMVSQEPQHGWFTVEQAVVGESSGLAMRRQTLVGEGFGRIFRARLLAGSRGDVISEVWASYPPDEDIPHEVVHKTGGGAQVVSYSRSSDVPVPSEVSALLESASIPGLPTVDLRLGDRKPIEYVSGDRLPSIGELERSRREARPPDTGGGPPAWLLLLGGGLGGAALAWAAARLLGRRGSRA